MDLEAKKDMKVRLSIKIVERIDVKYSIKTF